MKIAVCYPWSMEEVKTRFADTALNLERPAGHAVRFFRGSGWSSARRHNHCLEQAVAWGAELIIFIGADQAYRSEDMLVRLVKRYEEGHSFVTALVPIRGHIQGQGTKPFQPIVWRHHRDASGNSVPPAHPYDAHIITREEGELVAANGSGTGVLMFPVTALMKLSPPWFTEHGAGPAFERVSCTDWPFVNRLICEAGLPLMCDTTIMVTHLQVMEIDDSFTDRFADWDQPGKGDPSLCAVASLPRFDGMIEQARVSGAIPAYRERFLNRYGLSPYMHPNQPAVFFGCYTKEDWMAIRSHSSFKLIVWAGTDAQIFAEHVKAGQADNLFGPHAHHVAISNFIADDLRAAGLPFHEVPLCNVDESLFKPTHRSGRKGIYVYCPKGQEEKYGGAEIEELKRLLPEFEFITTDGPFAVKPEDMPTLYDKCFVGFRPTKHDGLSNTVIEMGLMGRRVIWNGNAPNALSFSSIEHAADLVRRESGSQCSVNRFGPDDYFNVSESTRRYIRVGTAWLDTRNYAAAGNLKLMDPEVGEEYDYRHYFDMRWKQGPCGAGGPDLESEENKWTMDTIRGLLEEHGCDSVLDVGCGSTIRWFPLPKNYVGVDVSPEAIWHARTRHVGGEERFRVLDVTKEDLPEADAVVCIDVLQHIKPEDYQSVFQRLTLAARKVLIVKTSIGIPESFYQFDHAGKWIGLRELNPVPGSRFGKLFVFEKQPVEAVA